MKHVVANQRWPGKQYSVTSSIRELLTRLMPTGRLYSNMEMLDISEDLEPGTVTTTDDCHEQQQQQQQLQLPQQTRARRFLDSPMLYWVTATLLLGVLVAVTTGVIRYALRDHLDAFGEWADSDDDISDRYYYYQHQNSNNNNFNSALDVDGGEAQSFDFEQHRSRT